MNTQNDEISYLKAEVRLLTLQNEKLLDKFIEVASEQKLTRQIAENAQNMAQQALIDARAPREVIKALEGTSAENIDWDAALNPQEATPPPDDKPSPRLTLYSSIRKKLESGEDEAEEKANGTTGLIESIKDENV